MMLEEDGESHITDTETEPEVMDDEGIAAPPSECLLNCENQRAPKHRRGRPKKVPEGKGLLLAGNDPSILKISSTSSTLQQGTCFEKALGNGSPFDQILKGISDEEQGLTVTPSLEKHSDTRASSYHLVSEQPITSKSEGVAGCMQDGCPNFSDRKFNIPKYIETQHELEAEDRIKKEYSKEEERCIIPLTTDMNNTTLKENVNSDLLLLQSWKTPWLGQGNQSSNSDEQGNKNAKSTESLTPAEMQICAVTEMGKTDNQPQNPPEPLSRVLGGKVREEINVGIQPDELNSEVDLQQSKGEHTVSPVWQVVKQQVDGVVSTEPEVKHQRKVGRPPKKRNIRTLLVKTVDCPQQQAYNCAQKICDGETTTADTSEQAKTAIKKKGAKSIDISTMDAAIKPEPLTTQVTLLDSDALQTKPAKTLIKKELHPVIPTNVQPQKKVGRPRKKGRNIVMGGSIQAGVADSVVSKKKSSKKSPQALLGESLLGKTVFCAGTQKKRGRGQCPLKSVSEVSLQDQPKLFKKAMNKTNNDTSAKKPELIQKAIGDMQLKKKRQNKKHQVTGHLKDKVASVPIRPPSNKPQKRGRPKNIPGETKQVRKMAQVLSKNVIEQQSHSVSQNVLLLPTEIKMEKEEMPEKSDFSHVNAFKKHRKGLISTVFSNDLCRSTDMKLENNNVISKCDKPTDLGQGELNWKGEITVDRELEETKRDIAEFKNSVGLVKLKRKVGRPFKKKTLIKMAKQLMVAQEGKVHCSETGYSKTRNFPQDILSHNSQKFRVKRERRTSDLWPPETHLRRYTRACKVITDYTSEKQGNTPALNHDKSLSQVCSFSDIADRIKSSESTIATSPAGLSVKFEPESTIVAEGPNCAEQQSQKRGEPPNTRKYQKVNVKIEESQQPVLPDFSRMQNPIASQEFIPVLSQETMSNSISFGETLHNVCKKLKKTRKIKQVAFKMEHEPLGIRSFPEMYNSIAVPHKELSKIPKNKLEGIVSSTSKAIEKTYSKSTGLHEVETAGDAMKIRRKVQEKVGMSQKNVHVRTRIKNELTDLKISNIPEVVHQISSPHKYRPLLQAATEATTITPVKVPRRRGRPRKDAAVVPGQEFKEEVKNEMSRYDSLADRIGSASMECPSQSPEVDLSCLNLPQKIKKLHKIDRRRKRFRKQKAEELREEAMMKPSEIIEQFNDTEEMHSFSQKHSKKTKLESVVLQSSSAETKTSENARPFNTMFPGDTGAITSVQQLAELNGSDSLTKHSRKGTGTRKRRKRKRSWWDDRGKTKGMLIEKTLVSTLEPSLQSIEEKAEVEAVKTIATDEEIKCGQSGHLTGTDDHALQTSKESVSKSQLFSQEIGNVLEEGSDVRELGNSLFGEGSSCQKSRHENIGISERQLPDNVIENQRQVSCLENDKGKSVNYKEMEFESHKQMQDKGSVDVITEETQLPSVSKEETGTSSSLIAEPEERMDASGLMAVPPRRKPGRPKKGDHQKEDTELIAIKDKDHLTVNAGQEMQVNTASKSETPVSVDVKSPETLAKSDLPREVLPDPLHLDVEIEEQSLEQCISKRDQGENRDEVKQSDRKLVEDESEESNLNEDGFDENMTEEISDQSSKPRGPGRPSNVIDKKPVECHFCGRYFHHISAYIIHRRIHTGERPYSCQECGKAFAQRSNLNTHRKIHTMQDPLQCPYCIRRFSNKEELLEHCQTHTQDQNRSCLIGEVVREKSQADGQCKSDTLGSSFALNDGRAHVCEVCGKGFRFMSMLKIHLRVHSGEKPFSCKVCGKAFSQACSVRVHEKIHWSVKPYVCTVCGKGFAQLGTLKTHLCRHMGESKIQDVEKRVNSPVTFQCHVCKRSFGLRHQYNIHMRTHSDVHPYTCDVCGQQYSQISDLCIHRQSCHIRGEDTPDQTQLSQVSQKFLTHSDQPKYHSPLQSVQQYKSHANQQSQRQQIFQQSANSQPAKSSQLHMPKGDYSETRTIESQSSHLSPMNFRYPHHYYPSRGVLFQSLWEDRKSDPRKYLCPRCGRLFRHLGRLRAHMLTHVRGHSYTCGRCGKTLENWNKFWLHQRVHRQKRGRFFCPNCGKGFRFAGLYKEHLQKHTEQKTYACPPCPHVFPRQESLRTHQREWHRSYKPLKCNICGKSFLHQGNLVRHSLIHHHVRSHYCPQCNISFPYESDLHEHLRNHADPDIPLPEVVSQPLLLPYQCGECDATFKTLDLLFRHQLCHSLPGNRKPLRSGEIVGQIQLDTVRPEYQLEFLYRPMARSSFQSVFSPANIPQNTNHYFCPYPEITSVYPGSSSLVPRIPQYNTKTVYHQDSSPVSHTYSNAYLTPPHYYLSPAQQRSNRLGHPQSLRSLANCSRLPQTMSPSTAVPFSEPRPFRIPPHPKTNTSVQPSSNTLTPPYSQAEVPPRPQTEQTRVPQKPLRTYEKSVRVAPKDPSSSLKRTSEEERGEAFECAECGVQFSVVPELYEHYLQHARGEV